MRHLFTWIWVGSLCLAQSQDWHLWSPRDEIAPKSSQNGAADELILEGGGNAAVFGGWERVEQGIRPAQWYRLSVRYTATGLDYEPLQLPVRLDWNKADGRRVGQPEYAFRVTTAGDERQVTLDALAPAEASSVRIQLLLQNAPRATVKWKDVQLQPIEAPRSRSVRVATVRLRPKGADPIARFTGLVQEKVPAGTDVILLPEGVSVVGTNKKYADVAEAIPGPLTVQLGQLAKAKNAWLVAGIYEREGHALYNTAVLFDRGGKLAGKYRKVYLPREELEGGLTPGSEFPVFNTDFGKVGMMICWDVQYADPARGLALRGAEMILMPIWGGNEALAKARAIENHLFLVSSGYDFPSLIYDPAGETLARTEDDGTVALATVDLNRRYPDQWLGEMRGRFFRELRGDVVTDPQGRK